MIECDKCLDKLRCTTGQKEQCDRGFKLKMCCRKYLATRKEEIIRLLIDFPNELINDPMITYSDICPMCKEKLFIRLQMSSDSTDFLTKIDAELQRMKEEDLLRVKENMNIYPAMVEKPPLPYIDRSLRTGDPMPNDTPYAVSGAKEKEETPMERQKRMINHV